jgi:hypothetical protein
MIIVEYVGCLKAKNFKKIEINDQDREAEEDEKLYFNVRATF